MRPSVPLSSIHRSFHFLSQLLQRRNRHLARGKRVRHRLANFLSRIMVRVSPCESGEPHHIYLRGGSNPAVRYMVAMARSAFSRSAGSVDNPILIHLSQYSASCDSCSGVSFSISSFAMMLLQLSGCRPGASPGDDLTVLLYHPVPSPYATAPRFPRLRPATQLKKPHLYSFKAGLPQEPAPKRSRRFVATSPETDSLIQREH